MNAPKPTFPLPLQQVITGISDVARWRLLVELMKEEALTSSELARRVGIPKSNASKHMAQLLRCQLVTRGYGNVYRIPAAYKVPGENALDFGAVVVRLDAVDAR
jgi:hypothetical protein